MPARLVVLLPVRNGAADLPGYFDAVKPFADAIVALDDGSTDETRVLLEAEPLVRILLTNPPRPDYRDWNDAENRNRLLEAAADLDPDWLLSLDADERFDPADGAELRHFVDEEALPGCAYGFKVFRMWGDTAHYSRAGLWVYRLFAWEPGQRFPDKRLHFVPIPTTISRPLWVRTTLRIQHLAGLTTERRQARFDKYRQADPDHAYQHSYRDLLADAGDVLPWEPRRPDLSVLALDEESDVEDDLARPALSAIVISRNDETRIARTVASVVGQECPWPFEVIVVTSGTDRTAEIVRTRFSQVTLVELPRPALPGEARNAGLKLARGDYVSFPGSHVELPPGSLAARLRAHDQGYAMVTGTALNGTRTRAGWASYFLDQSASLPGRPSTELRGAPSHCSYSREALLAVGGFPEDMRAGEDTVVNNRLAAMGYVAYRAHDVTFIHHSPCRTPGKLLRHHFIRGRGYGRILLDQHRERGNLVTRQTVRTIVNRQVSRRMAMTRRHVRLWGGDLQEVFSRVYPYVAAGAVASCLGTWYELLRPVRSMDKVLTLFGKPVLTVLVAGLDRRPDEQLGGRADLLMLVRVDLIARRARLVSIPRDLFVDIPGRGMRRINNAFHLGAIRNPSNPDAGPRLLRKTVEHVFGVTIDDHIVIDFAGFKRLIDALGGITVDVPAAIDDDRYRKFEDDSVSEPFHIPAGRQLMDGDLAMRYARTRFADNDIARRARHVELMMAMLHEARRLRSPRRIARLVRCANAAVQTSLGPIRKALLGWAVLAIPRPEIKSTRLSRPLLEEGRTEAGAFVYRGDPQAIAAFVQEHLATIEETERLMPPVSRSHRPNRGATA
jgi:LCP family protein required for cell wall assembly